jgi:hypothetical protein
MVKYICLSLLFLSKANENPLKARILDSASFLAICSPV